VRKSDPSGAIGKRRPKGEKKTAAIDESAKNNSSVDKPRSLRGRGEPLKKKGEKSRNGPSELSALLARRKEGSGGGRHSPNMERISQKRHQGRDSTTRVHAVRRKKSGKEALKAKKTTKIEKKTIVASGGTNKEREFREERIYGEGKSCKKGSPRLGKEEGYFPRQVIIHWKDSKVLGGKNIVKNDGGIQKRRISS